MIVSDATLFYNHFNHIHRQNCASFEIPIHTFLLNNIHISNELTAVRSPRFSLPLILAATERYRSRKLYTICNNNNMLMGLGHFYLQCISWLIFFCLQLLSVWRHRPQIDSIASADAAFAMLLFLLLLYYRLPAIHKKHEYLNSQIKKNPTRKRARVHK